jgi:16S rRNA C967 or C1407 C5-methylase (RsmB/RsmF family)
MTLSRAAEEHLARAVANGELDVADRLKGKPIADIDRPRHPGWWADQFVARERSHDRRSAAEQHAAAARIRFWRCADVDTLRADVAVANAAIEKANLNLIESDRLERFDVDDIVARWRRVRS